MPKQATKAQKETTPRELPPAANTVAALTAQRRPGRVADTPALTLVGVDALTWEYHGPYSVLAVFLSALRNRVFYNIAKRAMDVSVGSVVLVAAFPLIVVAAVLVKCTSPGPVLFRQKRIGKDGREFACMKFRTMVPDAEKRLREDPSLRRQFEASFKLKQDPRVTPVGAFLRKTSIDELPQLLHVVRGDMTLIGPRPIVREELSKYGPYSSKLITVKPGLSGFWQACGRSDTTYAERVRMDMFYIDNRCLFLDAVLLLLTPVAVLRKRGAC
jgi:lipopolysaccharide/colanic/teichoic acid biosynthesis glycosyltransferase